MRRRGRGRGSCRWGGRDNGALCLLFIRKPCKLLLMGNTVMVLIARTREPSCITLAANSSSLKLLRKSFVYRMTARTNRKLTKSFQGKTGSKCAETILPGVQDMKIYDVTPDRLQESLARPSDNNHSKYQKDTHSKLSTTPYT